MAATDELFGGNTNRELAAVLTLSSGMFMLDAASSLMSSPWTARTFGGDPEKTKAANEYLRHALIVGAIACSISAYISHSWWPIFGGGVTGAYLYYVYQSAFKQGEAEGSTSWPDGTGQS